MATNLRSKKTVKSAGPPQLIPTKRSKLALAASSSEAQEKFLQLMGLTKASITIQEENIFQDEEAQVIATALSHVAMLDNDADDPYFTPDQWRLHQKKVDGLVEGLYEAAVLGSSESLSEADKKGFVAAYSDYKQPRCKCVAHQSALEVVWKLIDMPQKLTDDWGNKLARNLLPQIFMRSDVHKVDLEGCKQGSLYAVNFILQLPSGESNQFTGWPDFTISRRYLPYAEQRLKMAFNRRSRVKGVGEIESPVTKDKTRALAQAGIYGVGQLANTAQNKMAVIVFYKDKSAQVAVATTHLPSLPLECSLGDAEYTFVHRVDSLSLKDPQELQEFARILVSTIRWVAESV